MFVCFDEIDCPPVYGEFPLWPKFSLLLFLLVCGRIRLKVKNDGVYGLDSISFNRKGALIWYCSDDLST